MDKDVFIRVRAVLKYSKLNQKNFAKQIGIVRQTFEKILSGDSTPSFKTLWGIKKEFPEIDLNWLIFGTGSMINNQQKIQVLNEARSEYVSAQADDMILDENKMLLQNNKLLQENVNHEKKQNDMLKRKILEMKIEYQDLSQEEIEKIKEQMKVLTNRILDL